MAAAVALFMAMAASCVTPPVTAPPANPAGLRTNVVDGGLEVTWTETPTGQLRGYQLQYRAGDLTWTDVPTTSEPRVLFTDVTPRTKYFFRVRTATVPGATPEAFSPAASGIYVEMTLPIMRITTQNYAPILDKVNYVSGTMSIEPNGTNFAPYSGTLQLRGRGNSTWTLPKKPYKVKLSSKSPLMGMPSSKDWVLLANYFDKSQLRTHAAEQISKSTDLAWTPSYQYVELVLNGDYVGVYQLAEPIKPAPTRINIDELEPTDIDGENVTGGYLLEIDDRLEENNEPGWRTPRKVPVVVKEPDPATREQFNYIRDFVNNFESTLFSKDYTDPDLGYAKYLDVNSFIDFWIVQELTRNGDSFWSSTFFYKARSDDKLHFGPIWDFDRTLGSKVTPKPQPIDGWYARYNGHWTRQLFSDAAFLQAVADRWNELAPTFAQLPDQLLTLGDELRPSIDNDAARWNYELGESDTPAYVADWLTGRIDWITTAFNEELNG